MPILDIDSGAKDYFIEVAEGNIAGASLTSTIAKNDSVGTSYTDVWGGGGIMALPTVAETYEISSTSGNDTAAGTGTRTVLVSSLDADFNEQVQFVTLDGTNWVTIDGTHIRPRLIQSYTAGSGGINAGDITLRAAGGGIVRNFMAAGNGFSYDGHFTVPNGKKAYLLQTFTMFGKDDAGNARLRFKLPHTDSSWIVNVPTPHYQNIVTFEVKALLAFPAKTDIHFQAISDTGTSDVTIIFEYQIVDE